MKFRKSLPLIAVGMFVMFMVLEFLPWLSSAQRVDACLEAGGQWDPSAEVCNN